MRLIRDMINLNGKLALVTGGQGWLGSAMSEALLELGARVVSVSRNRSQKFEISTNEKEFFQYKLDLDDVGENLRNKVDQLLDDVECGHHMNIDILINNMCVWPKSVDIMTTPLHEMEDAFDSNVIPQVYLMREAAKRMKPGASIINVTSMYGKVSPDPKMYRGEGGNALEYGASKAALLQATKYMAATLGRTGIRVNSISPGPFPRPGALDDKDWFKKELEQRTMLNRVAMRDEIKGAVALLATELGSYITGEDIAVDGGWTKW